MSMILFQQKTENELIRYAGRRRLASRTLYNETRRRVGQAGRISNAQKC